MSAIQREHNRFLYWKINNLTLKISNSLSHFVSVIYKNLVNSFQSYWDNSLSSWVELALSSGYIVSGSKK